MRAPNKGRSPLSYVCRRSLRISTAIGVIGAGDAAMAQDEATQKAIAANAKIQPYKRSW